MDTSVECSAASTRLHGGRVADRGSPRPVKFVVREGQCSMEGCLNPATATVSSVWNPDTEWSVCDSCQWLLEPDTFDSDENKTPNAGPSSADGSFHHDLLIGEKEPSSFVLQETTMSTKNHEDLPLTKSSCKCDEKAAAGAPTTWHTFEKVLSFRKLTARKRIKKCNGGGCTLDACSLWVIWKRNDGSEILTRTMFYACVDCQEKRFGGWPTTRELQGKAYMNEAKRDIISRRCSKQKCPVMPPACAKDLV